MFRRIVGSAACFLLLTWSVLAAPRKEASGPIYYHPSTVGDKSVFEVYTGGRLSWECTSEVTEVHRLGSAIIETVRWTKNHDECPASTRLALSDGGVYKLGVGDSMYPTPICIVRLPFKKGETWKTTYSPEPGEMATIKNTSVDEEEVEVSAGKFRCLRIETEKLENGETELGTLWIAPGSGLVRATRKYKDQETTFVLKSFTPGSK